MRLKYFRELVLSPVAVVKNIYHYKQILRQMVISELKGRFAGSVGGLLWNFVHPVLMLLVYLFVFVYIFKLKVGGAGAAGASAVYIMAGLFPWVILSEGLSRCTNSVIENANLIQKTYFPIEILTAKSVLTPFIGYGIAIVLLALYKIIFDGFWEIIFILPFIMLLQVFFTLGVSFLGATLSVFFRDVVQLVALVINFCMYLTPIVYSMDMLPEWARKVMYLNPMYPLISVYQSIFLEGNAGQWQMICLVIGWAVVFFAAGAFIFTKLKNEFADWL